MSSMNSRADRSNRRRKMNLELDLNVVPPVETVTEGEGGPPVPAVAAPVVIVDSDDEVIVCSPRSFEEATNARRNRRRLAVEVNTVAENQTAAVAEVQTAAVAEVRTAPSLRPRATNAEVRTAAVAEVRTARSLRPRATNADVINWATNEAVLYIKPPSPEPLPPPPSPPPPPVLNCPICMAPFQEEMTTRCGHIFCMRCIRTAIHKQAKCPTCRKKVTMRELIRVFLPAAN